VIARVGARDVTVVVRERRAFASGDAIRLAPRAAEAHLFDADSGARLG
jgi:hypothetical protein